MSRVSEKSESLKSEKTKKKTKKKKQKSLEKRGGIVFRVKGRIGKFLFFNFYIYIHAEPVARL